MVPENPARTREASAPSAGEPGLALLRRWSPRISLEAIPETPTSAVTEEAEEAAEWASTPPPSSAPPSPSAWPPCCSPDQDRDVDVVAEHRAAGVESPVPDDPEVLPVERRVGLE